MIPTLLLIYVIGYVDVLLLRLLPMSSKPAFFYHLKRSLSDTTYYQELRGKSFWFSLKYLYFLLLLVTLVTSVILSLSLATIIGKSPLFVEEVKSYLATAYPAELKVVVKNGELSTNVQEPYHIPYPAKLKDTVEKESPQYDRFITIDTKANPDNFADYHTLILVTNKSIVYPDSQSKGAFKVQQFDQAEDITIDKLLYDKHVTSKLSYLDYIPSALKYLIVGLLIVWPFLGSGLLLLWNLLYLVFATLLVLIVALLLRKDVSYGEIYRLSMHGMTFSILYSLCQTIFGFHVPFAFTAILVIWMFFVFRDMPTIAQKHATVSPAKKKSRKK